jgi:hypothetical protein
VNINKDMQEQPPKPVVEDSFKDPAGLLFSGKIKIIDLDTSEVLVEQRSE